jgi:Asp-tRNA(Asn)/Glu-tRNA(Gln) amidotransferase A subunit family amidase
MSELVDRATTDIAAGVTSRRFSAVDVADTFLVRIVRYDSAVKAICTRDPEARDTAAVWTDASPAEGRTLDARTGGLEICPRRGTEGSNPSPSSGESTANLIPRSGR